MITNVLLEHPWFSPLALAGMVLLAPLVGPWLLERPAAAWGLAGLSLTPIAVLTLTPVGVLVHRGCTIQWALPTVGRVELMANVVLFVAPVFLAAIALRRPLVALALGSLLSAGVEAVQSVMPGRACDTNDWLNNSLGALAGAALAYAVLRAVDARRRAQGDTSHLGLRSAHDVSPGR